jgi:hypothetical protein
MVTESLNSLHNRVLWNGTVIEFGNFDESVLAASNDEMVTVEKLKGLDSKDLSAMKTFLKSVGLLLLVHLTLSFLPVVLDDQLVSKSISKDEYFTKGGLWNAILEQKSDWSVSSFGVNGEHLNALRLIPDICIVSMEAKQHFLSFLMTMDIVDYA